MSKLRKTYCPSPWADAVANAYEAVYGQHPEIVQRAMKWFGVTPAEAQKVYKWTKAPERIYPCPV